jgi:methylated-DNA-[protein]-cysteine S-methyltransferase
MREKKNDPFSVFQTDLGWAAVSSSADGLLYSLLPRDNFDDAVSMISSIASVMERGLEPSLEICDLLIEYYRGGDVDLAHIPLDLSGVSTFSKKIYREAMKIGRGEVISYGDLALISESPNAARAVGGAMAKNPFAPFVPCHRVIGKDGSLCGFGGGNGLSLKKKLLEIEGVKFKGDRVLIR